MHVLKLKKALVTTISLLIIAANSPIGAQAKSDEFATLLKNLGAENPSAENIDAQKFRASNARTAATLTSIVAGRYAGQSKWHLLKSLHQAHPRLIISNQDIATINSTIAVDPTAMKLFEVLSDRAEQMLRAEAPHYSTSQEGALTQSRLALKHLTTFAAMYRLTQEIRYFKQARDQMLKIAEFPDWGPANFLDVAEMTASMAIGYDWLFDQLSEAERKTIRDAIVSKGIDPGLGQYRGDGWWRLANSNWNFVCNGGLTMGALAIAESEPVRAQKVVACALISSPIAFKSFRPDGGWCEGPMYWTYGTRYATYFLTSLQSALGTDFDLSQSEGLSETGFFRIYTESPTGKCFNFADSESEVGRGAQMFWLSRKYKQPVFAGAELHIAEIFPEMFHLLFYTRDHRTTAESNLPLNKLFKGVDVVCLRSSWTDPNASYVGFKGGDNRSHHAHLDLGTFVFDIDGLRWAEDIGPESYDLPGYFSEQRWHYYKTRTEGHNTLTSALTNQNLKAAANIIRFSGDTENPFAIADLSQGYDGILTTVKRGIKLLGHDGMLVQDEIEAPKVVPLEWHLHTEAGVQLLDQGRKALLRQQGKQGAVVMYAEILSPPGVKFSLNQKRSSAPKAEQPKLTDLTIPLNLIEGKTSVVVRVTRSTQAPPALLPLEDWH